MDTILRAAGDVVGTELSDPVDLGGSPRTVVLRCRTASGGSVVVKKYGTEPDGLRAFTAEAAGLSLRLAGPGLLGVDASVPLLVMEDLGSAPTLADVLLGDDPRAARDGLSAWARGLGRLAAASVRRRADLAGLSARYGMGVPSWDEDPWPARYAAGFPAALAGIGIEAPPELAGELERIATTDADDYLAFTPGDTCPDNNLLTPDGLRLIDFESACYQPVFLTAAYCRMPFSSCWCVFRLPAGLAESIEETYRPPRASAIATIRAAPVTSSSIVRSSANRRSRTAGARSAISRQKRSTSARRNATPSEPAIGQDRPGQTYSVNRCDTKPGLPFHSYRQASFMHVVFTGPVVIALVNTADPSAGVQA
ncbi:hypothetical protein [Streptosporangium sp. NPDC048865]|uniref:hypothetical protein n=1 Tax=Streptosporangium sp. NPDC048865 TaxID=3155766 RepID=UPI00343B6137